MSKGLWYTETFSDGLQVGLKVERSLFAGQSAFQKVEIFETARFGRALAIDGLFMTSERDEAHYHELLVQPAMCTSPCIHNVLIIGGGDGGSAREVLSHPEVQRCVMVEIDGMVVDASKKYLPQIGPAWNDPRLELRIEDGIKYVGEASDQSFDVVLLDGSDPVGPAEGLFNGSFYKEVARILKPDGVFALQSESPMLFEKVFFDIQALLRKTFAEVHPYFRSVPIYGTGEWSWTYASQSTHPRSLVSSRVEHIEGGSDIYNMDIHHGVFALPQAIKRRLAEL
ncbi:MAG: polyamine aminopropyltransferase [Myxococcales bacterium]|nr:polyamine aminopropyltransferase [Myxococcales bacterium]